MQILLLVLFIIYYLLFIILQSNYILKYIILLYILYKYINIKMVFCAVLFSFVCETLGRFCVFWRVCVNNDLKLPLAYQNKAKFCPFLPCCGCGVIKYLYCGGFVAWRGDFVRVFVLAFIMWGAGRVQGLPPLFGRIDRGSQLAHFKMQKIFKL